MAISVAISAFNSSETDLAQIRRARDAGRIEALVSTPDEPGLTREGELTFLDNAIDRSTGTIVARVTIDNSDFAFLSGQYVRVRLQVGDRPDALMAPASALGSNQMGKYVYVVGEGGKAELRPLELGPSEGALVSIVKGVSEGERVIVGNLQKIGPGSPVQVVPNGGGAKP